MSRDSLNSVNSEIFAKRTNLDADIVTFVMKSEKDLNASSTTVAENELNQMNQIDEPPTTIPNQSNKIILLGESKIDNTILSSLDNYDYYYKNCRMMKTSVDSDKKPVIGVGCSPRLQFKNNNGKFLSKNKKSSVIKYKIRGTCSKNSLKSMKMNLFAQHFNNMKVKDKVLLEKIFKRNPSQYNPAVAKGQGDSISIQHGSALEKLGLNPSFKITQKSVPTTRAHKALIETNIKLKKELEEKTTEFNSLLPRYKFLEENYREFLLLKADFIKVKENKIANGEYVEKYDESSQTWSTAIMCDFCVDTRARYQDPEFQQIVKIVNNASDYHIISKENFKGVVQSFKKLKNKVLEREKEYMKASSDIQYAELRKSNKDKEEKIQKLEKQYLTCMKLVNILQNIMLKMPEEMYTYLSEREKTWLKKVIRKIKVKYPTIEEDIGTFSEISFDLNVKQ